ncbi:MAG: hypothetical protein CVV24_06225 [Ignavibacteriae bacterium HGW-Ignavibacteriae-3]|nr:MAG: hypothetical protein CVV24_06225 [Ignavibacteriae bacterium HGW-Ignavibacteriae-3]
MKKIISILFLIVLFVSCDKDVFTGLVETEITNFGKVFVSTNPKGYRLFIDSKYMDVTSPDTIKLLSEGPHRLTLKHDVFSDSTMNIVVQKNSSSSIAIDMMKSSRFYAKVICSTNPQGAKIYLNDQPTGLITPATVNNVYPGEFEIKFTRNQYRDDSLTIKIKGGQYTEIYRLLEDTSRTVSYRTNNSQITTNMIRKVVVDKNNNKWIGSLDRGLMKFDGKNWTSFENSGIFSSKNIQDLLVDQKGSLWVATGHGLYLFNGVIWQNFNDRLPSNFVSALEEDVAGNIWIATLDGLVKYTAGNFQTFRSVNIDKSLVSLTNLSALSSSKTGVIWIGTSTKGIISYNGTAWSQYLSSQMDLQKKNVSDIVKDLIVDSRGNLWSFNMFDPGLGVVSALLRFNGSAWTEVSLPILYSLDVNSFYLDNSANIWMSINGALLRYSDTAQLKVYDADTEGFFSKQCTSFAIDLNGDGWLTTFGGGIAKLKKGTF